MAQGRPSLKLVAALAFAALGLAGAAAARPGAGEAAGRGGSLVTFEDAGPGPIEAVLTVSANGSARVSLTPLRSSTPSVRAFHLDAAGLGEVRSLLSGAGLPHLAGTYGAPNPGGVFTVVTSAHKSVEVFAAATVPAGLRRLDAYLDRLTRAHEPRP